MTAVLRATDLVRVYPGGRSGSDAKTALDGVSLELEEGTCLGIVGESGCGKSTLARLLIGLEPPTSGTVTLRGQPLSTRPARNGPGSSSSCRRIRSPRSTRG